MVNSRFTRTGASASPATNEISGRAAGTRLDNHAGRKLRNRDLGGVKAAAPESRLAWDGKYTSGLRSDVHCSVSDMRRKRRLRNRHMPAVCDAGEPALRRDRNGDGDGERRRS